MPDLSDLASDLLDPDGGIATAPPAPAVAAPAADLELAAPPAAAIAPPPAPAATDPAEPEAVGDEDLLGHTDEPQLGRCGDYDLMVRYPGSEMTEVFLAHKSSKYGFVRRAVIKRANHASPHFETCRQMLLDEARALAWLDHANVVQILDLGEDGSGFYLSMEHVDGTDLRRVNALLRKRGEALPFELACYIAGGVLRGLHHAHVAVDTEGVPLEIIHRDVNPSNVLISGTGHIKLTDFGVVKMRDRLQNKTKPGIVKGKFTYLAPEYILGKPCDARADVYAVGVMLFEMLTGRPAFSGLSAADIMRKIVRHEVPLDRLEREGVPPELTRIVERAAAGTPEERFASAEEMANTLETWIMRAGYHATPWILSAFFRQHELFEAERSAAAPGADEPAEEVDVDQVIADAAAAPPPPPEPEAPRPKPAPPAVGASPPPQPQAPPKPKATPPPPPPSSVPPPKAVQALEPAPAPEPVVVEPPPTLGAFAGELADARPADVLLDLEVAKASGTLLFTCGPIWKRLDLIDGSPAQITSNMGMETFGDQLVKAKLIKRADLDRAMRELGRGGEPLTARLLSRKLVDETQLAEQLGLNIADRLKDVLAWRTGSFDFDPAPPSSPALMPILDLQAFVEENRPNYEPRRSSAKESDSPAPPSPGKPSLTDALRMARTVSKGAGKGRIDEV